MRVFFLLLVIFQLHTALAETIKNKEYSVTIPTNWKEISPTLINSKIQEIAKGINSKTPKYEAGYQLKNKEPFEYPYILVTKNIYREDIDFDKATSELKVSIEDSTQNAMKKLSAVLSKFQYSDKVVDPKKKILFMNAQSEVQNVGKIKMISAILFRKNMILTFFLYTSPNEQEKTFQEFFNIIDSVSVDYDSIEIPKKRTSIWLKILYGILFGAIFGAFQSLTKKKDNDEVELKD